MKLYDFQMAPNPRRVRIFLAEKNIEIPTVQVNIIEGDNLKEEFLKINPRGLLPTLELDDGSVIDETVAICRYFEETHPEPNLMGTDALSKASIESCQRHMEFDGLQAAGEAFRNSFPLFANRAVAGATEEYKAIPELAERGKRRLVTFFDKLNERLNNNNYIAGDTFSIADITAFCGIGIAKAIEIEIPEDHSNTHRWFNEVSSRPSAEA